jgi:hypothetical protein
MPTAIGNRLTPQVFGYKSAGVGREITDYIQARMEAKPSNVDEAAVLARYMLEQATAHGEGCGGDIRISWLKNDGTAKNVDIDRHTTLILDWLDHQISKGILAAADPQYSDEVVEMILRVSTKNILGLRAEHREAIQKEKQRLEEHAQMMEQIEQMERDLKEKERELKETRRNEK